MASSMTTSVFFLSSKFLIICSGVVSLAILLKFFATSGDEFSFSEIWRSFSGWLKPPYLYLVMNGIIITIAASSRFSNNLEKETSSPIAGEFTVSAEMQQESMVAVYDEDRVIVAASYHVNHNLEEPASSESNLQVSDALTVPERVPPEPMGVYEEKMEDSRVLEGDNIVAAVEENAIGVFVTSSYPPAPPTKRSDSMETPSEFYLPAEKPLVRSRFSHRKPMKPTSEGGRALRVSKPKKHDTLENTWKMITKGRAMPLTRHLKKSEILENHSRYVPNLVITEKSETFKDQTNQQLPRLNSGSHMKLRKESSLSTDELNRRVEAFINKFNEEMRLQREQSLEQYRQMINRGS